MCADSVPARLYRPGRSWRSLSAKRISGKIFDVRDHFTRDHELDQLNLNRSLNFKLKGLSTSPTGA